MSIVALKCDFFHFCAENKMLVGSKIMSRSDDCEREMETNYSESKRKYVYLEENHAIDYFMIALLPKTMPFRVALCSRTLFKSIAFIEICFCCIFSGKSALSIFQNYLINCNSLNEPTQFHYSIIWLV